MQTKSILGWCGGTQLSCASWLGLYEADLVPSLLSTVHQTGFYVSPPGTPSGVEAVSVLGLTTNNRGCLEAVFLLYLGIFNATRSCSVYT
jgi:hypothetical protein